MNHSSVLQTSWFWC